MARTKGDPKGRKRPLMTEDELKCFERSFVYEREVRRAKRTERTTGVAATPQPPPGPPPTHLLKGSATDPDAPSPDEVGQYQPNCMRCDDWGAGVTLDGQGRVIAREPVCRACGALAPEASTPGAGANEYLDTETVGDGDGDGKWLDFSSTPPAKNICSSRQPTYNRFTNVPLTRGWWREQEKVQTRQKRENKQEEDEEEKAEWENVHVRRVLVQRRKEMVMKRPGVVRTRSTFDFAYA